jgi:hypothetical protein
VWGVLRPTITKRKGHLALPCKIKKKINKKENKQGALRLVLEKRPVFSFHFLLRIFIENP